MAPGQGQNHSRLIPTESSVDRTKPPFVAGIEVCQAVALGSEAPMPECSPQAHDQGAALEAKTRVQKQVADRPNNGKHVRDEDIKNHNRKTTMTPV